MKQFLKLLQWTLNAAVFFTLFAFALNNQHEAKVYFFFGTQWRSPMVLIVLIAFAWAWWWAYWAWCLAGGANAKQPKPC
jgi:uncharacterized integral membrane protein